LWRSPKTATQVVKVTKNTDWVLGCNLTELTACVDKLVCTQYCSAAWGITVYTYLHLRMCMSLKSWTREAMWIHMCVHIHHDIIEVLSNGKHKYICKCVGSLELSHALPLSLSLTCAFQPTKWILRVCVCAMTPSNVSHDCFKCVACNIQFFVCVRWLNYICRLCEMMHL